MDADDLYGLALDRFVAERAAIAKALRAQKRREEATAVAAMRKPSIAAWAVNQLVRTQGRAVKALFDAGDALRAAQSDLLAGRADGRTLRAAGDRERTAVDDLVQTARGLLSSEGYELSTAVVERVADTLHAAALDEQAREQVRDGRLERELRHAGLGLGLGEVAAATPAPHAGKRIPEQARTESRRTSKAVGPGKPAAKGIPRSQGKQREEEEAKRRAAAEREQRERAAARKAARAAESKAKRSATAAARAVQSAEKRRERTARALGEADEALATAREQASAAEAALRAAQAELADA